MVWLAGVDELPICNVPPLTVPRLPPVFRKPKLPDPGLWITIFPPDILKIDPLSSILNGASPPLVEPIVGKVRIPDEMVKFVKEVNPNLLKRPAMLRLPPSMIIVPTCEIKFSSAASPMFSVPLLTRSEPVNVKGFVMLSSAEE